MSARKLSTLTKPKPARVWQRMLSGRRLDLIEPSPLDIEIEDIALGLSRVARWNGQTVGQNAFSVAQHSILVLTIYSRRNPLACADKKLFVLLHDAPEYVIGDIISPFKAVMGGDYKSIENRLLEAIHMSVGLPPRAPDKLKKSIKEADTVAAFFEATQLAGFSQSDALRFFGRPYDISPDVLELEPWSAGVAQERFLSIFNDLMSDFQGNSISGMDT